MKINVGETATLLQSGPFAVTMDCALGTLKGQPSFDKPTATFYVSTTEDHTLNDGSLHDSISDTGPAPTDLSAGRRYYIDGGYYDFP